MANTLVIPEMTKKTESTSVKLAVDVWKMAKVICTANDQSLNEFLSDLLRPLLQPKVDPALKKLQALGLGDDAGKPRKK